MEKISYEKLEGMFKKYGYLPNDDLIWRTYIGLMQTIGGRNVGQDVYAFCLDGPAGTGKSSFALVYAKILEELTGEKIKLLKYTCNDKTGKEETFEDVNLVAATTKDAENMIIPGFITKAILECNAGNRVVLRVDEYDKAKPVEDSFLLEVLQEGSIYTSQYGEVKLKDPSKLQVILCKNDNRSQLSYPLTRRLNFVELEYTNPEDMAEIIGMKLKKQDAALKILVIMMYGVLYKNKDDYTRIPSASEVMIAIDEADILMKGGAPKQYIYKSIIKNLLKTKVDVQTFLDSNQNKGKVNEDIEQLKSVFNNDAESEFEKEALLLDLYNMFFKSMVEEFEKQFKQSLKDICEETNQFKSVSDYRLEPTVVGKKQESKFEMSDNWFLLGEIQTTMRDADNLVLKADAIKSDGPVFVIDDVYYITVVKTNISDDRVSLQFLCNKPSIPTGVVIKLKNIIEFMESKEFEFSFPLVTSFSRKNLGIQHNGFYEYKTNNNTTSLKEIFEDITEVKLSSIKLGNGTIIEGADKRIVNFGNGDKVSVPAKGGNIQLDKLDGKPIEEIEKIININMENPVLVSAGRKDRIGFDEKTLISKLRLKSKKKKDGVVEAFEPDIVCKYFNMKNNADSEKINEELLRNYRSKDIYNVYKNLDDSQLQFLSNFSDGDVNQLNVNSAIADCLDFCITNDVLNPNTCFVRPRNKYDCLSPDPKVYTLRLNLLNKNKKQK